jgi:urease accessory protein UreF
LQQASACADRSRVKGLCAFLSQAAAASGDEALSQQWQAAGDADTQAQQRLKEMDKADKAAAEAKKKAQQKGQKGKSAARALKPAVRLKRIGP